MGSSGQTPRRAKPDSKGSGFGPNSPRNPRVVDGQSLILVPFAPDEILNSISDYSHPADSIPVLPQCEGWAPFPRHVRCSLTFLPVRYIVSPPVLTFAESDASGTSIAELPKRGNIQPLVLVTFRSFHLPPFVLHIKHRSPAVDPPFISFTPNYFWDFHVTPVQRASEGQCLPVGLEDNSPCFW